MKIRIHVTKEILEESANCPTLQLGSNCAIALAVRDIFPDAWIGRRYDEQETNAIHPDRLLMEYVNLPSTALRFIDAFDALPNEARKRITPLSFDIDVPDLVVDHIGISKVERILSESKTLEKV